MLQTLCRQRSLVVAGLWAATLLVVDALLLSCTKRQIEVRVEDPREPELQARVAEADTYFRQQHLYGWRKAESLYKKARLVKETNELTDKLLLTGILRIIRERQKTSQTRPFWKCWTSCVGRRRKVHSGYADWPMPTSVPKSEAMPSTNSLDLFSHQARQNRFSAPISTCSLSVRPTQLPTKNFAISSSRISRPLP